MRVVIDDHVRYELSKTADFLSWSDANLLDVTMRRRRYRFRIVMSFGKNTIKIPVTPGF